MVTVDGAQVHDEDDPLQIGTQRQAAQLPIVVIAGMDDLLDLLRRIEQHLGEGSGLHTEPGEVTR